MLKAYLGIYVSISLGVFLFVLFFQPFPLQGFDFNNRLLFIAGLGAIVFITLVLILIVFNNYIQDYGHSNPDAVFPNYFGNFLLLAMSSVAFAFYLRFVGDVSITFHIMFKTTLICAAPLVVLWVHEKLKAYKQQNTELKREKENIRQQVEQYEDHYRNKSIEFSIDNGSGTLDLFISDIAFIKSADNYVEIAFKEDNIFKKKLIRSTLKNIEQQLRAYANFMRCHRICIVNSHYIENLSKNYNNHWLTLSGLEEKLPVSRQYLLKLKEVIR